MSIKIGQRKGAITMPRGFQASAVSCAIKGSGRLDLALLVSERKATGAAVFTKNRVKAWPVLIGQKHIRSAALKAVIVNSGNANCSNGIKNREKVEKYCGVLARFLKVAPREIFPSSTGIIGKDLPLAAVLSGIPTLVSRLSPGGGHTAARAILTTDTRTKEAAATFALGGKRVKLAVMAKGAGMIHPDMATTLIYFTTDICIGRSLLKTALKEVVDDTFNMMSVDNDMSTNDTALILANGVAQNKCIRRKGHDYNLFVRAFKLLAWKTAKDLVCDGEGVRRVCEIHVTGAKNKTQAKAAARSIANSMLFKTALHGGDPNFGRIVATLGAARTVQCNFNALSVVYGSSPVFKKGKPWHRNLRKAAQELRKKEVQLYVDLACGKAKADYITSDLSKQYVSINADYST